MSLHYRVCLEDQIFDIGIKGPTILQNLKYNDLYVSADVDAVHCVGSFNDNWTANFGNIVADQKESHNDPLNFT